MENLLVRSQYLRTINLPRGEGMVLYHSLFGNPTFATTDALKLVNFFESPKSVRNLHDTYDIRESVLEEFLRCSFIVEYPSRERKILREALDQRRKLLASGALVNHLRFFSAYCNFNCSYCSITQLHGLGYASLIRPGLRFPFAVAKQAVDAFLALVRSHKKREVTIRFFGGEPLIDWRVYERVVEYCSAQGPTEPRIRHYLNTNGSLISQRTARFLKEHNVKVIVSLDGLGAANDLFRKYPSGKGTYDTVIRGIDQLAAADVEIHLNVTLHSGNLVELRRIVDFAAGIGAKDMGIEDLCFVPEHEAGQYQTDRKKEMQAILDAWEYGRERGVPVLGSWSGFRNLNAFNGGSIHYCAGNGEEICVDAQGRVFPCYGIPVSIGQISLLEKCFTHPLYESMAMRVVGNIAACRGCDIEGPCGGACAADVFSSSGDLSRVEPEKCDVRRQLSKALLIRWATERSQEGDKYEVQRN